VLCIVILILSVWGGGRQVGDAVVQLYHPAVGEKGLELLLDAVQFPADVARGLGLLGQVHGVAGEVQELVQVTALEAEGCQVGEEAPPAPERGGLIESGEE
jgi:hypothetical protein